jgi:Uma2 family endonuclease
VGAATSVDREPTKAVLHGIPWSLYCALREATEGQGVRLTYLDGALEIMSPSELHEESAKLLARLLETWATEHDVDLRGYKSTTWRSEPSTAGAEADECYKLGPLAGGMPDIVIEVTVSRSDLKLQTYCRLGIREVWQWSPELRRAVVRELHNGQYRERDGSAVLPDLDLQQLASFVRPGENHTRLVRAYRQTFTPAE